MIKTICPQYIGAKEDFYQAAPLIAQQGYFQGYYSFEPEADTAQGACKTAALLQEFGLQPVGFRVPVDISQPEIDFPAALEQFAPTLYTAAACGYRGALTWIMPGCNTMPVQQYQDMLIGRLERLCKMLEEYGIPLGIEMVAPRTLQQQYRYPAPCRTEDLLTLIERVGQSGLGIILDSFHFYCAGHTPEEYMLINRPEQIVMVHISDGVAGRSAEEQQDLDRRLPGENGSAACHIMMEWLQKIGYQGAVIPEPLDKRLSDLPLDIALKCAANAVQSVWPPKQ